MNITDRALQHSEYLTALTMSQIAKGLRPVPALHTDSTGNPLCIDCEADITARRQIVPSTQRCTKCQSNFDSKGRV